MARRIQLRAIERTGELLLEIDGRGGDPSKKVGDSLFENRSHAAKNAGLSDDQRKQAVRIASIPKDEREALIEAKPQFRCRSSPPGRLSLTRIASTLLLIISPICLPCSLVATTPAGTLTVTSPR